MKSVVYMTCEFKDDRYKEVVGRGGGGVRRRLF